VHLEERSGNHRWSDNATTETPTGSIWMEREPEVACYSALFGRGFGAVG
jgi:hypothetical protein